MIYDEKIVLIGAGNMATRLAIALTEQGFHIAQIYSRTIESARQLQSRLGIEVGITNEINEIRNDASIYLFSISDYALPDVVEQMNGNDALWLHTAGSIPMDIFAHKTKHYGVLYPMQTVGRDREINWSEVPIFIEASTEADTKHIEEIAQQLSPHITHSNSEQRKALHLAAVFACNFTNHMYAIAEKLLQEQGLDFDVMKLLIRETERKAETMSPRIAQTGPAVRNDKNVMEKHVQLLKDSPERELYEAISASIERYKNKK